MTKKTFDEAVAEAKRFLERAKAVTWTGGVYSGIQYPGPSGVETGSLRRASMDLTRSLAKLRKT